VKVYVIRNKHNPTFTVPDCKLWFVEVQYILRQIWRSLINGLVYVLFPQIQDMQEMVSKK
jgi:hypothetical protein